MAPRLCKPLSRCLALLLLAAGCGEGAEPRHQPDADALDTRAGAPDGPWIEPDGAALASDAEQSAPDALPIDADRSHPDADLIADAEAVSPDAGTAGDGEGPPATATVVVLPDTQYYASRFPSIFADQTRWLVDQRTSRHIAAVLHVGDVVDDPLSRTQWTVAASSLRPLDGLVPYVLVPGNHDIDGNRQGLMDEYFAPQTMPWIAGTAVAGQIENNYALIDIGPQKWLVIGLEFGPRDAMIKWADGVLKANPTLPAIIVTHAYLYPDGTRYDIAVSGLDSTQPNFQFYIPQWYAPTPDEGINDGEMIWRQLILTNLNVRLVFCGHFGVARLTSRRPDGSAVHQMLSDYQWLYAGTAQDQGGSGYLRLLEFDYGNKLIRVQTYSPSLDLFMTDDANQFTVSLEM